MATSATTPVNGNGNGNGNGNVNGSHAVAASEYAAPMHVSASDPVTRTSLVFSIGDAVGDLDTVLGVFRKHSVSLKHIESRPSKSSSTNYDIFVDLPIMAPGALITLVEDLKPVVTEIQVVSGPDEQQVPWFPRKISDLDICADRVTDFSGDLGEDHPGFKDPEYRKRRDIITQKAKAYKYGQPLPRVDYTQTEIDTWGQVFRNLKGLHGTHACREHRHVFPLLEQNCGYREDNIPQLEDVSNFLKDCTGFQLRPVTGLLSSRDFLNSFAFRTFTATQYIRHDSKPHYTPEPDVCHELLGHAPLFADPYFAEFSQEIGLASLGASDADIERLATIFWYTVEFGLCREEDKDGKSVVKAYGAGLLSSFGELEYCLSDKPEKKAFDPSMAAETKYPVTQYQPVYFVASSFRDAAEKVRAFAATMDRPFTVRYNPYTQSVEIVDKKDQMLKVANEIKKEVQVLIDALSKV